MNQFAWVRFIEKLKSLVLAKPSRRAVWLVLSVTVLLFSTLSCSFKKPSAPSWDVDVTIPLVSKIYTMQEIADDEEAIKLDSTGLLAFEQTSSLDEYVVGEQLDIENMDDFFTLTLGSFDIDSPGSEVTNVALREIFSNADILDGQTAIIPSFNFTTEKKTLDTYDDFAYVVIETGSINILVVNGLVVPLGSPITLEVWDTVADTLVVTVVNSIQIPPNQSQTFSASLDGIVLPNKLAIRMVAFSPGSAGSMVPISADSRFEMAGEISALTVLEAMAEVPEQRVTRDDEVTITDSLVVIEAMVESGVLSLQLGGDLPLDAWLVYGLPDFYRPTGEAFIDSFFITRNQDVSNTVNLAGFALRPVDANFTQQKVRFDWHIRTIDTGENMALVRSSDVMTAGFTLADMVFSTVTGRIGQQDIDVSQEDIEFDIPADLDSIFFETAALELEINNGINFPAKLQFSIEGKNESGAISYLSVDEVIQAASQPGVPKTTIVRLNQTNSNIKDFISILPNLIKIDGQVALGDPNHVGTISKSDFVDGSVKITAPFSLKLPAQNIDSDVNELNIEEGVKDDIIDNIANGSFYAEISNHLPIGASVEVMFGTVDSLVFEQPILTIGPILANAASLDSNGYVISSQQSDVNFSLSEKEMKTFLEDVLYSGVRVAIDGTGGKYIKVSASDFIEIKSYSRIRVKVNQD